MAVFTTTGIFTGIRVSTDPYPCPFDLSPTIDYTDKYDTFDGCDTSGAFSPALPLPPVPVIPVSGDSLLQQIS